MNKKKFFQELEEKLPSNKYRERFLQELNDHLEDSAHAAMVSGKKKGEAEEKALKKMGEPKEIAFIYRLLTEKRSLFLIYFEGLLWGLVSIPLYTNSVALAMLSLNYNNVTAEENFIDGGIIFLFMAFIIAGVSFIFYSLIFAKFYSFLINPLHTYTITYAIVVFTPPIIFFLVMLIQLKNSSILGIIGGYLLMGAIVLFGVLKFNKKGINYLAERYKNNKHKSRMWLHLGVSTYLLLGGILTWLYHDTLIFHQEIVTILTPLLIVEWLLIVLGNVSNYFPISSVMGFWIIGWALSGILFLSLTRFLQYGRAIQKKNTIKFPWIYLTLFVFSVKLLVLSPASEAIIDWNKPSFEISKKIEVQQTWPFYTLIKYLTYDSGFSYSMEKNNDVFYIYDYQMDKIFRLSNIKSTTDFEISTSYFPELTEDWVRPESIQFEIPKNLECQTLEKNRIIPRPHPIYEEGPIAFDCPLLLYNNQLIYKARNPNIMLRNLLISNDNKWILIALSEKNNFSSMAEELYLVEL